MREVIHQKIVDALEMPVPPFTRRDVHLPAVKGKATAVIGPRRAGKTTFLWQILADDGIRHQRYTARHLDFLRREVADRVENWYPRENGGAIPSASSRPASLTSPGGRPDDFKSGVNLVGIEALEVQPEIVHIR